MDLFEEKFGEKFDANVRNLQLNPFDLKILKILIEREQQPFCTVKYDIFRAFYNTL